MNVTGISNEKLKSLTFVLHDEEQPISTKMACRNLSLGVGYSIG